MIPPFRDLLSHAWQSVREPRFDLRWVLAHDLPRRSRWEILILCTIATVIVAVLRHYVEFGEALFLVIYDEAGRRLVEISPYIAAIASVSSSVITVFLVYWAGRAFKGQGSFEDTILTIGWLQFVLLCAAVIEVVVALLVPPMAGLFSIVIMVVMLRLFSLFVAELHGFQSALKVLAAAIALTFVLIFFFAVLAQIFGPGSGGF